jgi:hypothetical protein
MKKGIYIFALLMATMALVAEIIIPHHHHEDKICFADFHSDAACENHSHSDACKHDNAENPENHHDAEGPENHQNCMLDVEIILPLLHDRSLAVTSVYSNDYLSFNGFTTLLIDLLKADQIPPGEQISHGPPILQFYSHTVFGSPGLRAPPVC